MSVRYKKEKRISKVLHTFAYCMHIVFIFYEGRISDKNPPSNREVRKFNALAARMTVISVIINFLVDRAFLLSKSEACLLRVTLCLR